MYLSNRESWTAIHGLLLGGLYLLAFTGGLVGLLDLKSQTVSPQGLRRSLRRLVFWTWFMSLLAWATVIVGTYKVYPWYRAKPAIGTNQSSLAQYPKYLLLSTRQTAELHEFGIEWKEHLAWLSPMLATAVAFLVSACGRQLCKDKRLRQTAVLLLCFAFFAAAVAGLLGALINKVAPVR